MTKERQQDNRRAVDEAAELGAPVLALVCGPALDRDLSGARHFVAEGGCRATAALICAPSPLVYGRPATTGCLKSRYSTRMSGPLTPPLCSKSLPSVTKNTSSSISPGRPPLIVDERLSPTDLANVLGQFWRLSAGKLLILSERYRENQGPPVHTVAGKHVARPWTDWTLYLLV